jgi:O-antigen/teichoic acid export membrane protein
VLSFAAVSRWSTNIVLLGCALHVTARNGAAPTLQGFGATLRAEWHEFWSFTWLMSLLGTLNVVRERAPLLLVGALLGPSAVGIYHVAERVTGTLDLVRWPFSQALYPEAARLATARRLAELNWLVMRIGAISGAIALAALVVFAVLGEVVLLIVGGPGYGDAYQPIILLIWGYCFAMAGIGLHSAILVTAGPAALFKVTLVPFLIFAVLLAPAIAQAGLIGAAAAQVVFYASWLVVSGMTFRNSSLHTHR